MRTTGMANDRTLRTYFREISDIPLLSLDEEKELAYRTRNGDKDAEHRLIQANLRFVIKVAKQFRKSGLPLLDLINQGNLGLIEAARRFDPDRQVRFTSYAVWWIRQSILLYISESSQVFRVSPRAATLMYRLQRATASSFHTLEEPLSEEALAASCSISLKELRDTRKLICGVVPIDHPVGEGMNQNFADTLEHQADSSSPEHMISQDQLKRQISRCLELLSPTEQTVMRLRFGLQEDKPMTLRQIGSRLGLSRERIRQIQESALRKIRSSSEADDLALYLN